MKAKTSILAVIKAFFILLTICCFLSCARNEELKDTGKLEKYDVAVVDSLKYIQGGASWYRDEVLKSHWMREDTSLPFQPLKVEFRNVYNGIAWILLVLSILVYTYSVYKKAYRKGIYDTIQKLVELTEKETDNESK